MAWTDITAAAKIGDRLGYIRYANQVLNIQGAATSSSANGLSVFNIQENTKYRVTMEMQSRFRLGCVADLTTGQTVTNYVFHPLDDNTSTSQNGATETLEITSEAGQIYLLVGGYSDGGGSNALDTLATIVVEEETAGPTYTVTYDCNYTGAPAAAVIRDIASGSTLTAPTEPTRTGYTFGGWYKESGCINEWLFASDTVTGNTTLYAKWTIKSYRITLTPGIGYTLAGGTSPVNHGGSYTFMLTLAAGYTDSTPTVKVNGAVVTLTNSEYTITNVTVDQAVTVEGVAANTYSVTLNANGGSIGSGNVAGYTYGTGATIPTDVTRAGHIFEGWYAAEDFSGAAVTAISSTDTGDKTYYAKWTEIVTCAVTYNYNYTGAPAAAVVTGVVSGSLLTVPVPPTRNGYTLTGWYREAACVTSWDFASDTVITDIILYAAWLEVAAPSTQEPVSSGYIVAYPATATTFTTNGLKILHPTRAAITCEDNADYFLEIETTLESREYLQEGKIIAVDVPWSANRQAFRCCNPQISGRRVSVKAWHVYYDAEQLLLQDSRAEDKTAAQALAWFNAATDATSPFTTSSNISETHTLYMVRKTLDDAIQSVIDYWGGHLVRDNFSIAINASIGQDRGLRVEYGNNMTSWRIDENWDNVCTRLLPVGKDGQLLDAIYADATGVSYDTRYAKVVSFNQDIDQADYTTAEGEPDTAAYTAALKADLVTQATAYLNAHKLPEINYQIGTYLPPAGAIIDVGDTVRIAGHPQCNMDLTTQVISYQYDCLMQQYVKIEIGNFKRKKLSRLLDETVKKTTTVIADVKTDTDNKINDAKTELEAAIESVSYTQYDSFIIPADGWVDDAENTFEHYPFKNVILVEGVESGMSAGNWMLNNDDYYEQGAKVAPGASVGSGTVTFYATQSLTVDITVEIMQIGR